MIEQLTNNWICWAIVVLALICYQQLWLEYFAHIIIHNKPHNTENGKSATETQTADSMVQHAFSGVLIGALPLLGLLGTIIGLLECFAGIASEGANSDLISGGIADALLTTQLGLVCAIPAWLLQAWVRTKAKSPATSTASSFIADTAR